MESKEITIFYEGSSGTRETLTLDRETDFYPVVARKITSEENGNKCTVKAGINDRQCVVYDVGIRSGTMNITSDYNTMPTEFDPVRRKNRYLVCLNREHNNYKYYWMQWNKDGSWTATYGRCAADDNDRFGRRSCDWEGTMWDIKYYEKEAKGYKDISKYVLAKDTTELKNDAVVTKHDDTPSSILYNLLHDCARNVVKREVHVPVNQALLIRSKELIDDLRVHAREDDVDAFNDTLSDLLIIMQRKIEYGDGMGVERMLAHNKSDFGPIIQREKDLCEVMEGSLTGTGKKVVNGDFSDYDIEVYDATPEQIDFVKRHLGDDLKDRIQHIYRVIPRKQKDHFDAYLKKYHIHKVKCFWHGSKNENWLSIIKSGLKLNPDAAITGKMFGKGIYFAPSAMKSWGYTSYHGSRWAGGRDDMGIMGLYATAYGTPYEIDSWSGASDYRRIVEDGPYDCLYAHANAGFLYNDEVIYYEEAAMELEYIVQFA